jgi:hypothetical protein
MKEDLRITILNDPLPQELARPSRRSNVVLTPFPESRCFATVWKIMFSDMLQMESLSLITSSWLQR